MDLYLNEIYSEGSFKLNLQLLLTNLIKNLNNHIDSFVEFSECLVPNKNGIVLRMILFDRIALL